MKLNLDRKEVNMVLNIIFVLSLQYLLNPALSSTIPRSDPYLRSLVRRYASTAAAGDCADCGEPLLLTPLIEANKLGEARNAAKVDPTLFMGKESYSGYLTVSKKYNSNLFFWYFPAPGKIVKETPLILWLQGGPGGSSMFGLFNEIGPFRVNNSGQLEEMPYSWGTNHSLLFIDNPVGTGFSFTDHDNGYATNQTQIGSSLYLALQQFLTVFPELRSAPLFIAGESYAGKHIPSLGIQIHWHQNTDQAEKPINLQGMAIGNGFVDPATLMRVSFVLREMGLIDDRIADMVRKVEELAENYVLEGQTMLAFYAFMGSLDLGLSTSGIPNEYNVLSNERALRVRYVEFLQQQHIRKALHVGNTTFDNINLKVYEKVTGDMMNSAKPWVEELLNHYRILAYNGHLDAMVPYHASECTYKSLVFEGAAEYATAPRHVWRYPDVGVVAGYYKSAGRFLEVMIRGAGHMVPVDKPAEALALISAFALNQPLDSPGPKPIGSSLYIALQQFLTVFSELRPAPFYIAGESYAGKHIPSLGIQIHWHRETDQAERLINLQGMAIGNGFIDPATLMRVSFLLREMGFIDDRKADMVREMEKLTQRYIQEGETTLALHTFRSALSLAFNSSGIPNKYNILSNEHPLDEHYVGFLQQHHIRKALHVGNTTFENISKKVYEKVSNDMMNSAKPWMEELLNHYRIMAYSGHLDAMVPYQASVYTYKSLVFDGATDYATAPRHVWRNSNADVAGYYKSAGRFLEVMVRGAGHMVPEDKPAEALALISAFALNQPLDFPRPKP